MNRAHRAALIKYSQVAGAEDSDTVGLTIVAQDGTVLSAKDALVAVVHQAQTTNEPWDKTADSSISATGKLLTPTSANKTVVVYWFARDAELQTDSPFIKAGIGTGGGANTSITVTGISTTDRLISCVAVDNTTGAWVDRTAATIIYAANTVRVSETTTGSTLFVMWLDVSPRAFSAINLQFGIATVDASPSSFPSTATLIGINTKDTVLVALCLDATDCDILEELTPYITVSATDTLTINEPSPTAVAGSLILVFYQRANDLG